MSAHCDLGSRYPIESCPTRIIKKQGYEEIPKSANRNLLKDGNIAIITIAKNLGVPRQNLRRMAIKLFNKTDFFGGLDAKMVRELTQYYMEQKK